MAEQQKAKKQSKLGRFFSKSWSELKKVTWPDFKTVVKNTGIVLLVVLFFGVVIFGVGVGLTALINLAK